MARTKSTAFENLMSRKLNIVLDDSVTATTCGTCHMRHISWDEYPVCSQDRIILGMSCGAFKGTRIEDAEGNYVGWTNDLLTVDGTRIDTLYLNDDETGETRPVPETLRIKECLAQEVVPDPFALNNEEWKALVEIVENPQPLPAWLKKALRDY